MDGGHPQSPPHVAYEEIIMQSKALPNVAVIKKEDKETSLKTFISNHFARGSRIGMPSNDHTLLLIARSLESPVVRALAGAIAEAGAEVSLKALILLPGNQNSSGGPAELAQKTEFRMLNDPRVLDAHEQLWLDGETAWIGDCMRREPSKRDAYEWYVHGCTMTAHSVASAFDRLWEKGHATFVETNEKTITVTETLEPHLAQVPPGDTPAPTAATRH